MYTCTQFLLQKIIIRQEILTVLYVLELDVVFRQISTFLEDYVAVVYDA